MEEVNCSRASKLQNNTEQRLYRNAAIGVVSYR